MYSSMIHVRSATVQPTTLDMGMLSAISRPRCPASRSANGSRNSASGRCVSQARNWAIQNAVSATSSIRVLKDLLRGQA
jgi:hypothetical protein